MFRWETWPGASESGYISSDARPSLDGGAFGCGRPQPSARPTPALPIRDREWPGGRMGASDRRPGVHRHRWRAFLPVARGTRDRAQHHDLGRRLDLAGHRLGNADGPRGLPPATAEARREPRPGGPVADAVQAIPAGPQFIRPRPG